MSIESVLHENRKFAPDANFSAKARVGSVEEYEALYRRSMDQPEEFWTEISSQLHWFKKWDKLVEFDVNEPTAKWFIGGETNVAYNCLDRHLEKDADKIAYYFEGEKGDQKKVSYKEMHSQVCKAANALKTLGVKKGDRVAIYMPMVVEAVVSMLACARIGAVHSVVFGGFSANALSDRINDADVKLVITADGGFRRGSIVPLKSCVDEALNKCPGVSGVLVLKRTGEEVQFENGRDHWWHDVVDAASEDCPAEPMSSEDPLFILYTSGSTGKPKGVMHTTGGYMVYTYLTSQLVFDLKPDDVFWCTADVGWITGHSYVTYGPMLNAATQVVYEGAPNYPEPDRFWKLIEKYKVSVFYTAPTAIRAFMKWGNKWPAGSDLTSLRLLGTVGEPINPEAWMWYREFIGGNKCPIVDTWWQTETGGIMITTLPGAVSSKPGSAGYPMPGIDAVIIDRQGKEVPRGEGGFLAIQKPWPGMLRTIYGDYERFKKTYWSEVPGFYFAGDGARCDEDGYFWIMGRIDDVVNVSGHRLGTMEVESSLVAHAAVAEAAVVGRPDEIKGEAIVAFVTLEGTSTGSDELKGKLMAHVAKDIGAIARPAEIRFADALPKTRSGKIMRRLLRSIAAGEETQGDISTLEDKSVLEQLREN